MEHHFLLGSPLQGELSIMDRAISQVEINEVLIRHPKLGRHGLKIFNRSLVEPDCDRLF
jgi:hypothetical protein